MKRLTLAAAPMAMLLSSSVFAFNLLFLKDAPVAEFNSVDTGLMIENFYDAMDNGEDGVSRSWSNEETGNSGTVTPTKTASAEDRTCRSVDIENHAGDLSAKSGYIFCKKEGSAWELKK